MRQNNFRILEDDVVSLTAKILFSEYLTYNNAMLQYMTHYSFWL